MGTVLNLLSNKLLTINQTSQNYKNENDFEKLTINMPLSYQDTDISDYTINLNVINSDNYGDVILINNLIKSENKYVFHTTIPSKWTYKSDSIKLWLSLTKSNNIIGITNVVEVKILDSYEVTEYIPEQSLSLLDDWTIEMQQLENEITESLNKNPYIGDNGNWYIYDYENNQFADSGVKAKLDIETQIKDGYWLMFGNTSEEGGNND